jgi:phosphoglycolate phosphatase
VTLKLLITDLDNTLYDWVDYYTTAFAAMFAEVRHISGVDREDLLAAFRRVHQAHGTSEYAFSLAELDVLPEVAEGLDARTVVTRYSAALTKFQEARRASLQLYEGVAETLDEARALGVTVVAHTDAMSLYAVSRVAELGLLGHIDGLVAHRNHDVPAWVTPDLLRAHMGDVDFSSLGWLWQLDPNLVKPNPEVLARILSQYDVAPHEALYVGDSLTKDIKMANDAGVPSVHAEYGVAHARADYELLVSVTHWTQEQVVAEREISGQTGEPSYSIGAFSDLVALLEEGKRTTG